MENKSNNTVSAFLINQSGIRPVKLEFRHDHGLSHIKELIECPKGILITARSPLPSRDVVFFPDEELDYGFLCDGQKFYGNAIVVGTSGLSGDLVDVNITFAQLASITIIDGMFTNIFKE